MSESLLIDGLIAVETPDTSGEVLVVKGCNIETMEVDGVLNYEHKSETEPGASTNDIVGKCVKCKKILSSADCDNERERMYWNMYKLPMIYGQFRLFNDDDDHLGARSLAGAMRSQDKAGEPQIMRFSIEGTTVKRDGNKLEETIARCVAITRKPANHAAVTGVLKGDTKPKSLLDDITEDAKKFEATTGYERLGGVGGAPTLLKNYNVAPGELMNSAALEVEHLSRKVKKALDKKEILNKVKTVLRDADSIEGAKAAIKHELGDVSPEFVNLFDNLADQWRIRKNQESFLAKATPKGTQKRLKAKGAELAPIDTQKAPHVRQTKRGEANFDEQNGVLYAPGQAYKFYVPNETRYEELFHHPELQAPHDAALKNWSTLNRLYRSGKLPDEVVALAGLFSSQSPNTNVPVQELAYGHWMDLMGQGFDPTDTAAEEKWGEEFKRRAASKQSPEFEKEIYESDPRYRTKAGEHPKIGLSAQKASGAMSYGLMHGVIKHLLSQGKSGREISQFVNNAKQTNQQSEAGEGVVGAGFAPKTIRYALGMAGLGDILVPDTHFIRHGFGLHKDDKETSEKIKAILWNPLNEDALGAMDRFFYRTHPAVRYTQKRLKELTGDDHGEHAIFPSFWAHWLSVAPHERLRGWTTGQSSNEGTDHAVYFNSVRNALAKRGIPFNVARLAKGEQPDQESMVARISDACKEIESKWGTELAQFAFYSHMVPALLANTHGLQKTAKAVEMLEALVKNLVPKPASIVDADKHGLPGLAHSPEQRELIHGLDLESQPALPPPEMASAIDPTSSEANLTAQMYQEGKVNYRPRLLVGPSGRVAFVKPAVSAYLPDHQQFSSAQRESAFHILANGFFGLGEHVPTTAAFVHPDYGAHLSAQEFVDGDHMHDPNVIARLGDSGTLDKLAIMDTVLHQHDRHRMNYLTSKEAPFIHLIDNGMSFRGASMSSKPYHPEYLDNYADVLKGRADPDTQAQLHPEARAWLNKLNPDDLKHRFMALGMTVDYANEAARRLADMQAMAKRGTPLSKHGLLKAPWGPAPTAKQPLTTGY